MRGTILAAEVAKPLQIDYEVVWDVAWQMRGCLISESFDGATPSCRIRKERNGWFVGGIDRRDLAGCVDVDLNVSPSTNTSAIRRANLAVGDAAKIKVAYVSFPEMAVTADFQSYERVSDRQYLFQSAVARFEGRVDVDEDGIVVLYHGIWQRIAYDEITQNR